MFGALLVASKEEGRHHPDVWSTVTSSRPYLDLAADALRRLDSGNRVIERCVEYLSQLSMILKSSSKHCLSSFVAWCQKTRYSHSNVALDESSGLRPDSLPMMPMYSSEFTSSSGADHAAWSDVDLGEFMMDNDLDFLGRIFNLSQPPNAAMDEV